jgi:hypothetical protein
MRHDYAACADLCEEHGHAESAAVLRAVAEGGWNLYMVRPDDETDLDIVYGTLLPEQMGLHETARRTRRLFLDRDAAERHAVDLTAAILPGLVPYPYELPYLPKDSTLPEFCRRVGAILGINYLLPDAPTAPIFPAWATREQLREIVGLISFRFFEVVEVRVPAGVSQA